MFSNKKLRPAKELLTSALSNNIAVGAFNFSNMEIVQAIVEAANEEKQPVILQASSSAIKYMGFPYIKAIVSAAAEVSEEPISLHLDHGKDFEVCKRCIDEGFTSVMIDASSLSFEDNIKETKKVVEYARQYGVSVEAELGTLAGVEDEVIVDSNSAVYTDPDEAAEFIERTNIDSLAIAIGTSHGPNKGLKGNPKLSISTLQKIKDKVGEFPLVLHGASAVYSDAVALCNKYGANIKNAYGILDQDIEEAIKYGIAKVNVDTDLRIAFLGNLRKSLTEKPENIDMRAYLGLAKEAVKLAAKQRIKTFSKKN